MGRTFSDDVDPNFDASSLPGHSRIGNRIPHFPGFEGGFPDSRVAGNRESGNGPFPARPGTGNRGPDSASRGFPGLRVTPAQLSAQESLETASVQACPPPLKVGAGPPPHHHCAPDDAASLQAFPHHDIY
jgi:hypothetical protein